MNKFATIKDSIYYWLGKARPFIVNNEYKIELLFIDKINNSAKILVTNIKNGVQEEQTIDSEKTDVNS
jgi:hypothetical protein